MIAGKTHCCAVAMGCAMETAEVRRRPRSLVVDDERPIASLLTCILERQGYETATAYSGQEAVCTACSFRPDCLLTDIDMPGMNGVDAAIAIRNVVPSCGVLFVSGHVSCAELMEQATIRGYHFELLNKPFHPTKLLEKVAQVLCCIVEEQCR